MQHRHARVLAAVLASGLLVLAGLGTVAAHDPGHGPGFPGTSAKPLPSGWAWPSDLKTQPAKSHQPTSPKPESSKSPHPTPTFTCPPTTTASPTPTSTTLLQPLEGAGVFGFKGDWDNFAVYLYDQFHFPWLKAFCTTEPLMKTLDAQINGRINDLKARISQIGKTGLSAADQSTVDGVLNSFIADLETFKAKVDSETTLAALQADLQTLSGKASLYRSVDLWVGLIVGSEKLIAEGPGLITLENKIAAEIAAAPAGPETTDAQLFLDDMKLAVTTGEGLVAPLPATLLAITQTELSNGTASSTLSSVQMTYGLAWWDLKLAQWASSWAEHEL